MYYVQRIPRGEEFDSQSIETIIEHDVKAIAEIFSNILENFEGQYQTRVVSKAVLTREGKAAYEKAVSDLANAKELQEKLWLALRSSSAFHPLHKVAKSANNLISAETIAEDEIHRAVKGSHSLREIGEAAKLSHERVRQIYNAADQRLTELKASCANGHNWSAYKYYFGIAPEECPVCHSVFSDMESPLDKPVFAAEVKNKSPKQTTDLVPVDDIVNADTEFPMVQLKDGSFRMIIKTHGFGRNDWQMRTSQEQDSILSVWTDLVNDLPPDCPIQILSHSSKLDGKKYLAQLEELKPDLELESPDQRQEPLTQMQLLMQQMKDRHAKEIKKARAEGTENKLYERNFYIVLAFGNKINVVGDKPSKPAELFQSLLKSVSPEPKEPIDPLLAVAKLEMQAELVMSYLKRMGLGANVLSASELINLYFEIFHPDWRNND